MEHISFYYFALVDDPERTAQDVRDLCADLQGHVIVAEEGINGMLAGSTAAIDAFQSGVRSSAVNAGRFEPMTFKRMPVTRKPFKKLKIKVKAEIVPLGVPGFDAPRRVADIKAADVPPAQWRELITRDDVVVLDNRNHFEYEVGHFNRAVDPQVRDFRDFAAYVTAHAPTWQAEGKTIAMYCTGGIRCEKSSAWMQDLGLEVKQLEGGILNYFKEMPDADLDWQGECFIFDDRVTLNTRLEDTGKTLADIPGQFHHVKPTKRPDAH